MFLRKQFSSTSNSQSTSAKSLSGRQNVSRDLFNFLTLFPLLLNRFSKHYAAPMWSTKTQWNLHFLLFRLGRSESTFSQANFPVRTATTIPTFYGVCFSSIHCTTGLHSIALIIELNWKNLHSNSLAAAQTVAIIAMKRKVITSDILAVLADVREGFSLAIEKQPCSEHNTVMIF